jgi:hypothetical protein
MWLLINRLGALQEYKDCTGIIVYTFIDSHMDRLIGSPDILSNWLSDLPWLELRDDHVVYAGTFFDRSPLQYLFLRHLSRFHLAHFLANRLPQRQQTEPLPTQGEELMAKLIGECADTAKREAPGLRFVCLMYPGVSAKHEKSFGQRLEKLQIPVLDYTQLFERRSLSPGQICLADSNQTFWGHPNPAAYDMVAEQMVHDLAPQARAK